MAKRQKLTGQFKAKVASDILRGDETVQEVAARHRVRGRIADTATADSDGSVLLRLTIGIDVDLAQALSEPHLPVLIPIGSLGAYEWRDGVSPWMLHWRFSGKVAWFCRRPRRRKGLPP